MAVLIRGDKAVNDVKLVNHLGALIVKLAEPEAVQAAAGCAAGFVGPTTLGADVTVVADRSVAGLSNAAAGCGEKDKHAINVNHGRDYPTPAFTDLRTAEAGETAPNGLPLQEFKGIEVGHIFKLGDKYSTAMKAGVADSDGVFRAFQMGCYGVGSTRIPAAIVEQHHDDKGIVWPVAVAPFDVHLVPMRFQDDEVRALVEATCDKLDSHGIDYLLDDRKASPGVKFGDADAIGLPFRVTFGRGLANGTVELQDRGSGESEEVVLDSLATILAERINAALEASSNPRRRFG